MTGDTKKMPFTQWDIKYKSGLTPWPDGEGVAQKDP